MFGNYKLILCCVNKSISQLVKHLTMLYFPTKSNHYLHYFLYFTPATGIRIWLYYINRALTVIKMFTLGLDIMICFCLYNSCLRMTVDTHTPLICSLYSGYLRGSVVCDCIFLQRDIISSLNSSWQRSECLTFLKCKAILLLQRVNGRLMIVPLNLRDLMQ